MKKVISLILVLVLCLGLCACGKEGKFIGTFKRHGGMSLPTTVAYNGGRLHTDRPFDGEFEIVINSDGTGSKSFVADSYEGSTNVLVYECPITWEVVDDYLYVTGSCTFEISNKEINIDDRYRLEGKTLVDVDTPEFTYKKQ